MQILVTGGSGYLGTEVRKFFDADDFSRRAGFDILSEADAERLVNYDAVIHLAANLDKSPANAEQCFLINGEGTANLLRHVSPGAVFIYASTKDVYGVHADKYIDEVPEGCPTTYCGQNALEWSKLLGEQYVQYYARARGFRACILRLSNVYAPPSEGNEYGFAGYYVDAVRNGWNLSLPGEGKPVRDLLYVDDFARACQMFIDSDLHFGLYNVGGGRDNALSLNELVALIGSIAEVEPVIEKTVRVPAPVPFNYVSDITLIGDDLGWTPTVGIEDGLRKLLA